MDADRCQFMYNGRTGPLGRVCGRPESEHCPSRPGALKSRDGCQHSSKEPRVHHTFTRAFKCPTCGTREVVIAASDGITAGEKEGGT